MGNEKRPADPRDRLFCATLAVGLEQGFGRVTLNAVAERAGVSKGGLLHHFQSKTELIEALLLRCVEARDLYSDPAVSSSREAANADLDSLAIAALIAGAENPALLRSIAQHLAYRSGREKLDHICNQPLHLMIALAARLKVR